MEAHAGTISIGQGLIAKPRARGLTLFRDRLRARRRNQAIRASSAKLNGVVHTIPGSEHTHLILPPKAY
jgi:hypothetical protein